MHRRRFVSGEFSKKDAEGKHHRGSASGAAATREVDVKISDSSSRRQKTPSRAGGLDSGSSGSSGKLLKKLSTPAVEEKEISRESYGSGVELRKSISDEVGHRGKRQKKPPSAASKLDAAEFSASMEENAVPEGSDSLRGHSTESAGGVRKNCLDRKSSGFRNEFSGGFADVADSQGSGSRTHLCKHPEQVVDPGQAAQQEHGGELSEPSLDDDVGRARPPPVIEEEEAVPAGDGGDDSIGDIDPDELASALRLAASLPDELSDE